MNIRNSAKAIIIHENQLLVVRHEDSEGAYFGLPGGGQEHGENLHDALRRECLEEIGEEIEIGDLIFIREYIGKNHEFAIVHDLVHQIEYMFLCMLKEGFKTVENGIAPDNGQIGVEWLPLEQLMNYKLYPQQMRKHLLHYLEGKKVNTYLGDVN